MCNDEILEAVINHLMAGGWDRKSAKSIVRNMSDEDLMDYYAERLKTDA